ncbi:MAG TPA: hypothetical protein PLV68_19440, partial [Ilumatobacteraceae bacterium]|nr:hypothetical protein [Ilumatobacteraceae bacterium]
DAPFTPPDDPNAMDLGIEPPSRIVNCTAGDVPIEIQQYASDAALRGLGLVGVALSEAFGVDPAQTFVVTAGDGVIAYGEAGEDIPASNEVTRRI